MSDITNEDIAALLAQGDLYDFLRHQVKAGQTPDAPAAEQPDGHRPGAWPTGSRPPAAVPAAPPEEVERAVTEFRDWLTAGQPDGSYACDCLGCRRSTPPTA